MVMSRRSRPKPSRPIGCCSTPVPVRQLGTGCRRSVPARPARRKGPRLRHFGPRSVVGGLPPCPISLLAVSRRDDVPGDAGRGGSRAWLKMEESLRWSQLPIPPGARVAEIGSAGRGEPGVLARGLVVTGIDPAEMAPSVLDHHHFTHIRRRSTQVRRREFRKIRWLTADMNVAPRYTLAAVEAIVTHPEVNIRGLLLTLKLPTWDLAGRVPEYLDCVRNWGYNVVRARQLQHNRREICVAASKNRSVANHSRNSECSADSRPNTGSALRSHDW